MAVGSPKASSTPKTLNLKGRRGIRDNESIQSPIPDNNEYNYSDNELQSDHDSNEESEHFSEEPEYESKTINNSNINVITVEGVHLKQTLFLLSVLLTFCAVIYSCLPEEKSNESISTHLNKQFPLQGIDFGLNIEVAFQDIRNLKQPKCIIFLHENDNIETTERVLKSISEIAYSELSASLSDPLILTPSDLNTEDNLKDHGKIIIKHKDSLEKHRVMIIKNLDQISGISAQVFHSFCDETFPIIKQALLLFTVNVPKLPTEPNKYLRDYLRQQWNNLDEDKFAPLFARMSSILLLLKE